MNQDECEIVEYEEAQGRIRLFVMDGGLQSAVWIDRDRRNDLIFAYMISFAEFSKLHPHAEDVLVIGAGMFSYPRWLIAHDENVRVDALDPDEELFDYACDYFWLDELIAEYHLGENGRLNFIAEEGRSYLESTGKKYDIIINDAFNGLEPVPDLCTKEALEVIKEHLKEGGMYLVNLPGYRDVNESDYLRSSIETIRQVFRCTSAVRAQGTLSGDSSMNYVVMASDVYDHYDGELKIDTQGLPVYTDADAEAIYDSFDWM